MTPANSINWKGSKAVVSAASHRIVLLSAPAGWGKTTAATTAFPFAPVVLCSSAPNSHGRLIFALASAFGMSSADAGKMLESNRGNESVEALAQWAATLIGSTAPAIIDDIHEITDDPLSYAVLLSLAGNSSVRLILAGRHLDGFPVGSWLLKNYAQLPLGTADLAFDESDCARFLEAFGAPPKAAAQLVARSEGWPLGIYLAATSMARGLDLESSWRAVASGLQDVVVDEVATRLPESDQARLLEACLAASIGASFHSAIRGVPWSNDRPHQLVVDGMIRRCSNETLARTADIVADRLESLGMRSSAYDVLLRYSGQHASDLLAKYGYTLFDEGRFDTIRRDLAALPGKERASRDVFLGLDAMLASLSGDFARSEGLFNRALSAASEKTKYAIAARFAFHRLKRYEFEAAAMVLEELPPLSEKSTEDEVMLHAARATNDLVTGAEGVFDQFDHLFSIASSFSSPLTRIAVEKCYAFAVFFSERWNLVDESAKRMESLAKTYAISDLELSAHSFRYPVQLIARGDLEAARQHAMRMYELAKLTCDSRMAAMGLVAAYQIEVYAGRWSSASAISCVLEKSGRGWRTDLGFAVADALVMLHEDNVLGAIDRVASLSLPPSEKAGQRSRTAFAAVLAASRGMEVRAKELLDTLPPRIRPRLIIDRVNEEFAEGCAAMAELLVGRRTSALQRLSADATTWLGASFVEAARVLAASEKRDLAAHFLEKRGLAGVAELLKEKHSNECSVQLTSAESKVLALLSEGMTPKGIAEASGRSVETVRSQVKSAMRKLGASNVNQALVSARRLGLIVGE